MGCLLTKFNFFRSRQHEELEEEAPKQYSWDLREKIDISQYTIENQKDATLGRTPGQVNGQQFIIANCQNCNIYIYDHISTVTVDDCEGCNFFLGPITQSIFIRDCKQCKFVVACQQFRTRDCNKIDIILCCNTQPIIESSSGMRFGCFQYHYPSLEAQFKASGLSVFNNNWSNIHDFTQDPDEVHWSLLPEDAKVEDFVPISLAEQFSEMNISLEEAKSVVPKTLGKRRKNSDEGCLLVFFNDGSSTERALTFIDNMREKHPSCVLVQTKEVMMQSQDAARVFDTDAYSIVVLQGPVIGLEYNGDGCIEKCQEVVTDIVKGSTSLVFISQSKSQAEKQIEDFYNFADMQMSA